MTKPTRTRWMMGMVLAPVAEGIGTIAVSLSLEDKHESVLKAGRQWAMVSGIMKSSGSSIKLSNGRNGDECTQAVNAASLDRNLCGPAAADDPRGDGRPRLGLRGH